MWRLDAISSDRANPDDVDNAMADVCRFFNNENGQPCEDGTRAVAEEVLLGWLIDLRGHFPDAAAGAIKDLLNVGGLILDRTLPAALDLVRDPEFRDAGDPDKWSDDLRQRFRRRLDQTTEAGNVTPWLRTTPPLLAAWLAEVEPEPAKPEGTQQPQSAHGPDFRDCIWCGVRYTFTARQAACVKVLWEAWTGGTPDVGDSTILELADSDAARLPLLFRQHPAWGAMIVEGSTKGTHRLAGEP